MKDQIEHINKEKTGRRCVYTKQEITAHRTAYMLSKKWYCECCDHDYSMAGKWKHLSTKKHKINSKKRKSETHLFTTKIKNLDIV